MKQNNEENKKNKKSYPVKPDKNNIPKPVEEEDAVNSNPIGVGNPPPTKPPPPKE